MQGIMILLVTKYHEQSSVSWLCCVVIFNSSISFRFKDLKPTKTFINSFCKTQLKYNPKKNFDNSFENLFLIRHLSLKKMSSVVYLNIFLKFLTDDLKKVSLICFPSVSALDSWIITARFNPCPPAALTNPSISIIIITNQPTAKESCPDGNDH